MKAVIMAGGRGERLRPFTYVVPKPLLPVNETNAIENSISKLSRHGFRDFLISVNYLKNKFDICLEYEKKFDISIKLVEEPKRMGTAGSLRYMREDLKEPFLLQNGDLFADVDYTKMYKKFLQYQCDCLVGMKKIEVQSLYGVIDVNDDFSVKQVVEKPTTTEWINSGIYILKPDLIEMIGDKYTDITDLISKLLDQKRSIYSFDIGDRWIDIGKIEDYKKVENIIKTWK